MARHSWCRVKVHVYVCTKCGCGKVNEEPQPGRWQTRFYPPSGRESIGSTPTCEVGPRTVAALRKYESAIAVGGLPKEDRAGA